jgi:hypothetical protein
VPRMIDAAAGSRARPELNGSAKLKASPRRRRFKGLSSSCAADPDSTEPDSTASPVPAAPVRVRLEDALGADLLQRLAAEAGEAGRADEAGRAAEAAEAGDPTEDAERRFLVTGRTGPGPTQNPRSTVPMGAKTEREKRTRKTERAYGNPDRDRDRRLRSRKKSPRASPPLPFE